jgi:hypothetical protein
VTGTRQRIVAAWDGFWFAPGSALNLAAARVIVAAHSLWFLLSRDFAAVSGLTDFWTRVPESHRWRYLLFPGHVGLETGLQWAALAALAAALLGIYPRVACGVSAVLLYHLAPLESVIWTASASARGLTLAPPALVILACSPADQRLTLWPRRASGAGAPPPGEWEYGWPLRLAQLLVCQVYLFAAYAKLVATGLSWGSAASMRRWFLLFNSDDQMRVFTAPGLWVADQPLLCLAIGTGAVLFEWSFILALWRRTARRLLVPIAVAFHAGILVTLNVHVGESWLILLLVDWERLLARAHAPGRIPAGAGS